MRRRASRVAVVLTALVALVALPACTERNDPGSTPSSSAAPATPDPAGYTWAEWMRSPYGTNQSELQVKGDFFGSVSQNRVRLDVYGNKDGQMLRKSPFVDTTTYKPLFERGDPSYITTLVLTNEGNDPVILPFEPMKIEGEYYGSPYSKVEPATEQGDMTDLGYSTGPAAFDEAGGYSLASGESAMVSTQWPFLPDDILQLHVSVYKAGDSAFAVNTDDPLIRGYVVDVHTPGGD